MLVRRWNVAPLNTDLAAELSELCEISPFLSLLLTSRGLDTPEQIYAFLAGQEEEIDPFDFVDMHEAVARIREALEKKERILVYGDYDVDGITATALLYTYLRDQGADVLYRLPDREEGYGLHVEAVEWAAQQGVQLLITVDTGVTACEAVMVAAQHGIDVVVTDHHQPPAVLPAATAVVNPNRADCPSSCKEFAGVGVAFMLACALEGDGERVLAEYGDLLTLGTLADVIPLTGFNRDLMRRGLQLLNESTRPGIVALRELTGQGDKTMTATSLVFTLVPRLNAPGRMETPDVALRLLLAQDAQEAMPLAERLQALNARRQDMCNQVFAEADTWLSDHPEWLYQRVLVVDGENWHGGVLGIVAARLSERYGKPAVVFTKQTDGIAHGSCRSLKGFNLYEALCGCERLLTRFGGHELAAGVTLPCASIADFRRMINDYAASHCPCMPVPALDVAVRLRPDQISAEKLPLLDFLEPVGAGNPAPLFGLYRMRLDNITALSGGKHIRLSLSRDGVHVNAVRFQLAPEEFPIPCGSIVNCVVSLEKNEYKGVVSVSIRIQDIGYADTEREALIESVRLFENIMRRECRPTDVLPDREQLAHLYSLLKACGRWCGTLEQLHRAVQRSGCLSMTPIQVLVALQIWCEAGLLEWQDSGERFSVCLRPVTGKMDLTHTPLWRYLEGGEEDRAT